MDKGLWHSIETVIKIILKKRKCKEEDLQIVEKRREAQGKGEQERYIHLNAEFQRIARRVKKAFLSDQCKEIEGKKQNEEDQRSLQENQRYHGNISCKDGHNGENGMNLTEVEDIMKGQKGYT